MSESSISPQPSTSECGRIKVDEYYPSELDEPPPFDIKKIENIRTNVKFEKCYEISKHIGDGKFGKVYQVREKETGQEFAAKFIKIRKEADRQEVEREVSILTQLRHPRIAQIYDAFYTTTNDVVLIMEVVRGGELFDRVADENYVLTEQAVIMIICQLCEAIQYIHEQHILHLDIKPENIMCVSQTGNRIKLIDFGLARHYDGTQELKYMAGTPEFAAPEVIKFEKLDFYTDMWSVGVITYILLSGYSPFLGDNLGETYCNVEKGVWEFTEEFDEVSAEAKDFVSKLIIYDQSKRMLPKDCLLHPWIARHRYKTRSDSSLEKPAEGQVMDNKAMMRYNAKRKFRRMIIYVKFLIEMNRLRNSLRDRMSKHGQKFFDPLLKMAEEKERRVAFISPAAIVKKDVSTILKEVVECVQAKADDVGTKKEPKEPTKKPSVKSQLKREMATMEDPDKIEKKEKIQPILLNKVEVGSVVDDIVKQVSTDEVPKKKKTVVKSDASDAVKAAKSAEKSLKTLIKQVSEEKETKVPEPLKKLVKKKAVDDGTPIEAEEKKIVKKPKIDMDDMAKKQPSTTVSITSTVPEEKKIKKTRVIDSIPTISLTSATPEPPISDVKQRIKNLKAQLNELPTVNLKKAKEQGIKSIGAAVSEEGNNPTVPKVLADKSVKSLIRQISSTPGRVTTQANLWSMKCGDQPKVLLRGNSGTTESSSLPQPEVVKKTSIKTTPTSESKENKTEPPQPEGVRRISIKTTPTPESKVQSRTETKPLLSNQKSEASLILRPSSPEAASSIVEKKKTSKKMNETKLVVEDVVNKVVTNADSANEKSTELAVKKTVRRKSPVVDAMMNDPPTKTTLGGPPAVATQSLPPTVKAEKKAKKSESGDSAKENRLIEEKSPIRQGAMRKKESLNPNVLSSFLTSQSSTEDTLSSVITSVVKSDGSELKTEKAAVRKKVSTKSANQTPNVVVDKAEVKMLSAAGTVPSVTLTKTHTESTATTTPIVSTAVVTLKDSLTHLGTIEEKPRSREIKVTTEKKTTTTTATTTSVKHKTEHVEKKVLQTIDGKSVEETEKKSSQRDNIKVSKITTKKEESPELPTPTTTVKRSISKQESVKKKTEKDRKEEDNNDNTNNVKTVRSVLDRTIDKVSVEEQCKQNGTNTNKSAITGVKDVTRKVEGKTEVKSVDKKIVAKKSEATATEKEKFSIEIGNNNTKEGIEKKSITKIKVSSEPDVKEDIKNCLNSTIKQVSKFQNLPLTHVEEPGKKVHFTNDNATSSKSPTITASMETSVKKTEDSGRKKKSTVVSFVKMATEEEYVPKEDFSFGKLQEQLARRLSADTSVNKEKKSTVIVPNTNSVKDKLKKFEHK